MELLARLVDESGCSLLLVTHSRRMAAFARRRLLLEGGALHAVD
jgi:predicted ABC-type transport system involved in lysophospholipase L1 biosynthesis ATPase subunit